MTAMVVGASAGLIAGAPEPLSYLPPDGPGMWAVGTAPEVEFVPPPPPPGFASTAVTEGDTLGSPIPPPPPPPGFSATAGAEALVPPPPPGFASGGPAIEDTFAVPVVPPPPPSYSASGDVLGSLNGAHAAPPPIPPSFSPATANGEVVFGAHAAPLPPPPVFPGTGFAEEGALTVPPPVPAPPALSTKDMEFDEQWQAQTPPQPDSSVPEWPGDNLVWPPAAPPPGFASGESLNDSVVPGSPVPPVLSSASFVAERGVAAPVPAAPAGFDPADLTGDFAIGAPTAAAAPLNGFSPQELLGEEGLGAPPPSAPSGFSPADLGGAFQPEGPPPPPPIGIASPMETGIASPMETDMFDVGFGTPDGAPPPPPPGFDAAGATGDAPPPLLGSAQSAFLPNDFVGNDALGGAPAPMAKGTPTKSTSADEPPPLITPDFFARAGRRKR